jgi:hypothetical protein
MLSGKEIRLSIGIFGGARYSFHLRLMVNLVTLSRRRQGDQRSGSILSKVLMSRIVLLRLSARDVGRYLPTPSSKPVVVVQLPFGAILNIRNVAGQEIIKNSYHNLK